MDASESQLPSHLIERADLRSNELAWHPSDIPAVIEAARCANLINLGGDLQVRAPSGLWGEPIGVSVDVSRVGEGLQWMDRVDATARAALSAFEALQQQCDFEAIAQEAFPALVAEVADPQDAIFFGWLLLSESEEARLKSDWT